MTSYTQLFLTHFGPIFFFDSYIDAPVPIYMRSLIKLFIHKYSVLLTKSTQMKNEVCIHLVYFSKGQYNIKGIFYKAVGKPFHHFLHLIKRLIGMMQTQHSLRMVNEQVETSFGCLHMASSMAKISEPQWKRNSP